MAESPSPRYTVAESSENGTPARIMRRGSIVTTVWRQFAVNANTDAGELVAALNRDLDQREAAKTIGGLA